MSVNYNTRGNLGNWNQWELIIAPGIIPASRVLHRLNTVIWTQFYLALDHLIFKVMGFLSRKSDFVALELKRHSLARPRGYKTFSCSTQLSMKFILLLNVKMPTIVGILTFISKINTISEWLKARNFFICRYFSFLWAVEISCLVEFSMKKVL